MPKIKLNCPHCGATLLCDEESRARRIKCPHCREKFPAPRVSRPEAKPLNPEKPRRSRSKSSVRKKLIWGGLAVALLLMVLLLAAVFIFPPGVHWADRRPIGVLFVASNYHTSPTNPRGWFNDRALDVTGTNGAENFRRALTEYTDRSLDILKRTGAQGVIVWDVEGEQFPHKTTFIGDPRLLNHLAPEMDAVTDEFFKRLRDAGLQVGVTIRPQQLSFDEGEPRQKQVLNELKILRAKIDYARKRWGATLFYIDSNGGIRRPDEILQFRVLAQEYPNCLIMPEHHWLPYFGFSTPYETFRKNADATMPGWVRRIFPHAFRAVDVSDAGNDWAKVSVAQSQGDILLFRAWCESQEVTLLEKLKLEQTKP
jgi:hypothetical protein